MYYIIRHGFRKPTKNDLAEYQLGWSIDDGILYIHDPKSDVKVQKVISDEAIQGFIKPVIVKIENSAKEYFKTHMTSTEKLLRDTYERNIIYTVSFNKPKGQDIEADDLINFNFYLSETKDDAIEKFIEAWEDDPNATTKIDLEGTKVILTDNLTQNVYFYIVIRNDENKLVGKFLTTLESSIPMMSMEYSDKTNKITFKSGDEVLNEVALKDLTIDGGTWGEEVPTDTSEPMPFEPDRYEYSWLRGLFPDDFNEELYEIDENGLVVYIGEPFEEGTLCTINGKPYDEFYVNTNGDITHCPEGLYSVQDLVLKTKVEKTEEPSSEDEQPSTEDAEPSDQEPEVEADENSN